MEWSVAGLCNAVHSQHNQVAYTDGIHAAGVHYRIADEAEEE
jgi:hypothetical protein